jgi:hypothetical protein
MPRLTAPVMLNATLSTSEPDPEAMAALSCTPEMPSGGTDATAERYSPDVYVLGVR